MRLLSWIRALVPLFLIANVLVGVAGTNTVVLAQASYTVNAAVSGGHGTVSPATQSVAAGGTATINISPNLGYTIGAITDTVNSVTTSQVIANPFDISSVSANHSVMVTFAKKWWQDSFRQRKKITINNTITTDNLTDYEVKIPVTYTSGMRADFGDVRFVAIDNTSELSYWLDTSKLVASASAEFWVKIPIIPAANHTDIYMYYGNAAVTTTSNIHSTFILADDFESASLGTKTDNITTCANIDTYMVAHNVGIGPHGPIQQIIMDGSNKVLAMSGDNLGVTTNDPNLEEPIAVFGQRNTQTNAPNLTVLPPSYIAEVNVKPTTIALGVTDNSGATSAYITSRYLQVEDKYESVLDFTYNAVSINKVYTDNWSNLYVSPNMINPPALLQTQAGTWYTLGTLVNWDGATNSFIIWVNGIPVSPLFPPTTDDDMNPTSYPGLGLIAYNNTGPFAMSYDNFKVRHYAWQEPVVNSGSFSSAETLFTITTGTYTNVTTNSATLNGSMADLGISAPAAVSFVYSSHLGLNTTTPQSLSGTQSFNANITGLAGGTTYQYYVKADLGANGIITGSTLSFSTNADGSSGGLPGGGFPGGGGVSLPGYTNLSLYTNINGLFVMPATIKSEDGLVWLIINNGTLALNSDGTALTKIGILKTTNPPAVPANWKLIGVPYDVLPDGAKFSEKITLVMKYDAAALSAGLSESKLMLCYWDATGNKWVPLDGSAADAAADTISGTITHFSTYAVMIKTAPASFTVSDLKLNATEVDPGTVLNVGVKVSNSGDLSGDYSLSLSLDNTVVQKKDITLNGGDASNVTMTVSSTVPGTHTVKIGDLSAVFTVKKPLSPASFSISNLSVTPDSITEGDSITISATVANTGETEGNTTLTMTIDGVETNSQSVTIAAGDSKPVSFTTLAGSTGTHTIKLNETTKSYTVNEAKSTTSNTWVWFLVAGLVVIAAIVIIVLLSRRKPGVTRKL